MRVSWLRPASWRLPGLAPRRGGTSSSTSPACATRCVRGFPLMNAALSRALEGCRRTDVGPSDRGCAKQP
eukprot:scaffold3134_cov414-Prasinococcus_capsulatus_cf.AAC.12